MVSNNFNLEGIMKIKNKLSYVEQVEKLCKYDPMMIMQASMHQFIIQTGLVAVSTLNVNRDPKEHRIMTNKLKVMVLNSKLMMEEGTAILENAYQCMIDRDEK
jgi:hypothetical protein